MRIRLSLCVALFLAATVPAAAQYFAVTNTTFAEGNGTTDAYFTVTRHDTTSRLTAHFTGYLKVKPAPQGTANVPTFSAAATFEVGEATKNIPFRIIGNDVYSGISSVEVKVEVPGNGFAYLTINEDDPMPVVTAVNVSKLEKDSGMSAAAIWLTASSPVYGTVRVRTRDGSATTADGDYMPETGQLTFFQSNTTGMGVSIYGDTKPEGNETFTVELDDPVNVTLATTSITVTIENDDVALAVAPSLISTPNPSTAGQAVTLTATLPAAATGTMTFYDGATSLGTVPLSGGNAMLTTSALALGSHSVTAMYSGDAGYGPATSPAVTQVVQPAGTATTLASSVNPSSAGDAVTFTATVPNGATGAVTFYDHVSAIGFAVVQQGTAVLTVSDLGAGQHSVTAVYSGDSSFQPGTSTTHVQLVNALASSVALTTSANPGVVGQNVTLTATVPRGATGLVRFVLGGVTVATRPVVEGRATFTMPATAAGSHRVIAVYAGDAMFAQSVSPELMQTVVAVPARRRASGR